MKTILSAIAACAALALPASAEDVPIRFTLDWKLQGVHAPFYLAEQRGYFAEEGLDVTIDQGEGSAATISRIMSGAYDAGFGDMNAIIQNAATMPEDAPVMVYQIYNQPPFSVVTKADGPILSLSDLEGRTIGSPAGSAVTVLFGALAKAADIDTDTIEMLSVAPNLQEQVLVQGQVDPSLVFNVTSYLNLIGLGLNPDEDFRWFPYGASGLDIYSNGVMVSQALHQENPEAVAGLVRAINRATMEIIADPAIGAAAVKSVEPLIDEELEALRLTFAMDNLMFSDETRALGIGAVDMERLARSISVIADLYDLPTEPTPEAVFDGAFLPEQGARSF